MTDGLGCWSALDEAACSHQAIRTGSGPGGPQGIVQMGEHDARQHQVRDHRDIASSAPTTPGATSPVSPGATTGAKLETMIPRFVHSAARTEPLPYRLLIAG